MAGKKVEMVEVNPVNSAMRSVISVVAWIAGILVSLAVGSGMISGTLPVPFIPQFVLAMGGWTVIILTLAGAFLALMHAFTRR